MLLAYAVSLLSNRAASEDVVQQVFTRLLRGDLQINGAPTPYLYRAVRNAAQNFRRDHVREVDLDGIGWLESPPGKEDDALALQSALRVLPSEQREVVVLHVWGQMTFDEVAATLDVSPNTVASRYRYGLARLRSELKPLAEKE
jgi:RNA polymerase sigma-70 factor (ECF subfamily)